MERISRRCFQEIFSHKNTANERESFPQTTLVTAILQQKITSIIAENAQISQQDSAWVYPPNFCVHLAFSQTYLVSQFSGKIGKRARLRRGDIHWKCNGINNCSISGFIKFAVHKLSRPRVDRPLIVPPANRLVIITLSALCFRVQTHQQVKDWSNFAWLIDTYWG